jgi:hypothetical protein
MTDLTEQWRKGELTEGWYWVDYYSIDGAVMLEYIPQHNGFGYDEKNLIQAVLSEVPDYIEWRNIVNCACEEHKENNCLLEENAQLKELLKECRPYIGYDTYEFDEKVNKLLTKIDEALK